MLVVSLVLCVSLLKDGDPEGAVVVSNHVVCDSSVAELARAVQWHLVVDNDSVGKAERLEVDSVDAIGTNLILAVQENRFDLAWDLGHGGACSKEPTVAKATLVDVIEVDSILTVKGVFGVQFAESAPIHTSAPAFSQVSPEDRVIVSSEVGVSVHGVSVVDGEVVVKGRLGTVLAGVAGVGSGLVHLGQQRSFARGRRKLFVFVRVDLKLRLSGIGDSRSALGKDLGETKCLHLAVHLIGHAHGLSNLVLCVFVC